ncbi:MAG: DUF3048 C-terminal domain-containing protein [Clostridia bacterium]|nr:DUF3048 C-terminal domain-containing protein [Clostridia bacterium]
MNRKIMVVWLLLLALLAGCGLASGESAGNGRLEAYLTELADGQKDGWMKAILTSGPRDISWEGDTVSFSLRSYDPKLKELGTYAKTADPEAWWSAAAENLSAWDLQLTLTFEADGTVSKKQREKFLSPVKTAASTAKNSLNKKDFAQAVTDRLFRVPTTDRKPTAEQLLTADPEFAAFIEAHKDIFPCEDPAEWAPLLYLQRNWSYGVKNGPQAIKLTWDAAVPARFLEQAYDSLTDRLARMPGSERPAESELPALWRNTLAEQAIAAKKKRLVSQSITMDLEELLAGKAPAEYADYMIEYIPDQYLARLTEGYRVMPATPAQDMPKNGVITKIRRGRGVMVKVPKDGRNTYVQLRDADTGVIISDAFVEPGKNVTMKVPEGFYVAQYASGSTWYGTEGTFGPLGTYLETSEFIVAKKKVVLTAGQEQAGITLTEITAGDMAAREDTSVHVKGVLAAQVPLKSYPANNPVIEGVSSTTGLAASGEKYTPIVLVLDNAEEAYPHWGVTQADIIFQIPNAGSGATKLLGLFADHYPQQAGPVRSGRSSMFPVAMSFDAAFAFWGPPAVTGGPVDLLQVMQDHGMNRTHRVYNMLLNNGYGERLKNVGSHNASVRVRDIHDNLIAQNVAFEERPFLFTDEKRTTGDAANVIRVLHRGEDKEAGSNSASRAVFKYQPDQDAYIRDNSSGTYSDRLTGKNILFANVIVLRVQMSYEKNYIYLKNHMAGSGTAEIFQNGKYVRGAWYRADDSSRLVLVDENGDELKLQRGKSFIVITNDVTDVIYTEQTR